MEERRNGKERRVLILALAGLAVVLFSSLGAANVLYCLGNGESLPPGCSGGDCRYTCDLRSGSGFCQVCTTDNGYPGVNPATCFGQTCSFLNGGGGGPDLEPPVVTVNSPVDGMTYGNTRVAFDIAVDSYSRIEYKNNDDTSWHGLCSGCTRYNRHIRLEEGENEIRLRVKKLSNNMIVETTIKITIDSKEPDYRAAWPDNGQFANGEFGVEYTEENLNKVELNYKGAGEPGWNVVEVEGCDSGERASCSTIVGLDEYENGELEYYFSVCDAASCDSGDVKTVRVDSTPPVLIANTLFDSVYSEKNILFDLSVNEDTEIFYVDNNDGKTPHRRKRLCNDCGNVNKFVSFRDGEWDITIFAEDDAGNIDEIGAQFVVDTKKPRMSRTYPSGFASQTFEVEFQENSPDVLTLFYGSDEQVVDLGACIPNRNKLRCSVDVDLTDYDGQEIGYWFELVDIVGNLGQSRTEEVKVDTSFPVINSIEYELDRNKAEIVLDITEENLDEVTYFNHNDRRPREKRLCSRLPCDKTIRLNEGVNQIDIQVFDEAGNSVGESLEIVI